MKTAVVIGATGLVGTQLVHLLLADDRFNKVIVFGRRSLGIDNAKLEEHLINFDTPDAWQHLVKGDVFFSTLGTTLKQAGGQNAQYKVDYLYQYQFARAAAQNEIPVYVLVSSPSASPDSVIFYSRMKGTLERDVKRLEFPSTYLIQPGLLYGDRKEERTGEKLAYKVLNFLSTVGVVTKYRPIHGKVVAQAMINAGVAAAPGVHTNTLEGVFNLAGVEHS
ncbi:NAD-dependent epimerase/dehydratase family protein [Pontibacter diazotrophicus]|uniref:NAD-dependent epimerase/dehydratase family protein n=1 Tax=Pontibacter diazotrophicus TaxID=1400979 RepID=A0A3D8LGQ8_9BACT|nr:NAD-dependent epimerase/dehydratase family protein [Pontibacter diazotrophicus]RDV16568.1 NAD-dependent epimerase/dehydratase family protein [Pontibacter diazotrophicus]